MQIVYATGQPRGMCFAITEHSECVPPNAVVYATCRGEELEEHLDEDTFNAITDEEFFQFKALTYQARKREMSRQLRHWPGRRFVRTLFRHLFSRNRANT